jgi:hypothetical protein
MLSAFDEVPWQMDPGERAALEGLLCQVRPELAIEIGTADGGSLRLLARYSGHVHSFDLAAPPAAIRDLTNVSVHTGDSHSLLAPALARLAAAGRNVDFVLVDGDHSADGVERDVRDLLASGAVNETVIVLHDTLNDEVRAGLARIDVAAEPKIVRFEAEFVAGRLHYRDGLHHQLWGGLGVMVIGAGGRSRARSAATDHGAYNMYELVAPVRDALVARECRREPAGPSDIRDALAAARSSDDELSRLRAELAELRRDLGRLANSRSWRFTAPLRAAADAMRNGRA